MKRYTLAVLAALAFTTMTGNGAAIAADHTQTRIAIVGFHATIIGPGKPLLIGDSNTEGMWWNYTCNANGWLINGGIGGITVAGFLDVPYPVLYPGVRNIDNILTQASPRVATVMLGTNDSATALINDPSIANGQWELNYNQLIDAIQAAGVVPALFTVPPVAATSPYSLAQILRFNTHITYEAASRGLPLKDIYTALADSTGYMKAGGAIGDGVHFSHSSQVAFFYMLEHGIAWAFAILGKNCIGN